MNAEGDTKKTLSSWLWSICQLSNIAAEEGWVKLREEHKIAVFTPTKTIHVLSGPEPGHVKSITLNLKINHSKSKLGPLSARDPLVKGPARMRVRMILGNSRISRDRDFFFFSLILILGKSSKISNHQAHDQMPMERSRGSSHGQDPRNGWEHSFPPSNLFF